MVRLGPFVLRERLGRGGMGEVWRAAHPDAGVDVAVKLLAGSPAARDLAAFKREVRAVAGLRHGGIVLVLDHGVVDAAAAQASDHKMRIGSPWLAMELATGGSLDRFPRLLKWREVRAVLLAVLDALAHAHARGVIHRDIKPGNVLLVARDDPAAGIKLTDFGISQAWGEDSDETNPAGTPQYMAPEQIMADWRDLGPWTDLYSVGCLAWRLAAGRTPFGTKKGYAVIDAHLYETPPALQPLMPVPEGFAAWAGRLLAKDRYARFRCAADAAHALAELSGLGEATAPVRAEILARAAGETVYVPRPVRRALPRARIELAARPAPMPSTWRGPAPPPPPLALLGAGLRLFGVRSIPLVGREPERDRLWEELRATAGGGRPRLVVLKGGSGLGKSRLAQSFAERAAERGAAVVIPARFGPADGPGEALARMVAAHLACAGIPRHIAEERVAAWLGPDASSEDVDSLVELVQPGGHWRLENVAQRHAAVRLFLARAAADRPAIVIFDDVEYGEDGLQMIRAALDDDTPVLFLACAGDDALARRPAESERLDDLLAHPRVGAITVPPLAPGERAELVRELLHLDLHVAVQVEERSHGNPLFVMRLVADWIERGVLRLGPGGFVLRPGEPIHVPDGLHEVWRGVVDGLALSPSALQALRCAAVLGTAVDMADWTAIVDDPSACADLVERLQSWRLAEPTPTGWRFAHGMLRESLLRDAREAGVLERMHAACARRLEKRASEMGIAERLGTHLLAAGQTEAALAPLMQGVFEREEATGVRSALALFAVHERAMEQLQLPPSDPRHAEAWLRRADLYRGQGEFQAARALLERIRDGWKKYGWKPNPNVMFFLCSTRHGFGDVGPDYEALFDEWRALIEHSGDPVAIGKYWYQHSNGRPPAQRAEEMARALQCFREAGDERGVASTLRSMAMDASIAGDEKTSLALGAEALARFEAIGTRSLVAICVNGFGESYRRLGQLDRAEAEYRRALRLYRATGDAEAVYPQANLALIAALRRDWDLATRELTVARTMASRQQRTSVLDVLPGIALPITAGRGDWAAWDGHLLALEASTDRGLDDADVAQMCGFAATIARERGEVERAERAEALAARQWRMLGRKPLR